MNEFAIHILNILKSNGFPEKKVSLPTEKMYETADNKGLNFNRVLEHLKSEHQVDAEIKTEKIIFFPVALKSPKSKEEMMKEAQEMMSKMDPAELQRMKDMFMNMSTEEREEIMKKGKEMGII